LLELWRHVKNYRTFILGSPSAKTKIYKKINYFLELMWNKNELKLANLDVERKKHNKIKIKMTAQDFFVLLIKFDVANNSCPQLQN